MIPTCAKAFAERVYSALLEVLDDPRAMPGLEAAVELACDALGSGSEGRYQAALLVSARQAVEAGAAMSALDFAALVHGAFCGAADATPATDDFAAAAYGMPREVDLTLLEEPSGEADPSGASSEAEDPPAPPVAVPGASSGAEGSAGAVRSGGRGKRGG